MYYVANRKLVLSDGNFLEKNERVSNKVSDYLKDRYTKLGFFTKVYDTEQEENDEVLPSPYRDKNAEKQLVEDYKNKLGGIKKLAVKHKITEYTATKILKEAGLV